MLNKAYQEELRIRNKKLLQQNMVAAILGDTKSQIPPLRDIRRQRRPFKPSSVSPDILSKRQGTKLPAIKQTQKKLAASVVADLQDAETGAAITYTADYWTGKEGRIDLNPKTIVSMGTGKLDIHKTKMGSSTDENIKDVHGETSFQRDTMSGSRHPLFQEFIKKGPLVERQHKWWSSHTDSIEVPDGEHLSDSDDEDSAFATENDSIGGSSVEYSEHGDVEAGGVAGAAGVAAAVSIGSLAEGYYDEDPAGTMAEGQVVSFALDSEHRGSRVSLGTARSGTGRMSSRLHFSQAGRRKSSIISNGTGRRSSILSSGTGRRSSGGYSSNSARRRSVVTPSYAAFLTNRSTASSANPDADTKRLPKIGEN
jgi:hypothetical protein